MAQSSSARRYAKAAFDIAASQNRFDTWLEDLKVLLQHLESGAFRAELESVRIPFASKKQMLEQAFGGRIDPLVLNLALLLAQRSRIGVLPEVVAEFQRLLNERRGIAEADVTTAVPMSEAEQADVKAKLTEITGKQIVLRTKVDPEIIGGLIARIGDQVIDGSARTRLLALRRRLAG